MIAPHITADAWGLGGIRPARGGRWCPNNRARFLQVLPQTSHVDSPSLRKWTGLPGQGVKLLRWTQFACRVQLAFANHVHDLDSRQGYRG
jgi:hypothetical protein